MFLHILPLSEIIFSRILVQDTALDKDNVSLQSRRQICLVSSIIKIISFSKANVRQFCLASIKWGFLSLRLLNCDANQLHVQNPPGLFHLTPVELQGQREPAQTYSSCYVLCYESCNLGPKIITSSASIHETEEG